MYRWEGGIGLTFNLIIIYNWKKELEYNYAILIFESMNAGIGSIGLEFLKKCTIMCCKK